MRPNLDAFFRHDERTVEQSQIADRTGASRAECEGAAGVTGDVIADDKPLGLAVSEKPEDLRGFTVEPRAKVDILRDRIFPPVSFVSAFAVDVARDCLPRLISGSVKRGVLTAARDQLFARPLFDQAAALEDDNSIEPVNGCEPMGHDQGRA